MTTPVTSVSAEATLTEIADLFATQSISGVPVIDGEQHVVGFVSDTDIINAMLDSRGAQTSAFDLMSAPVVTVDEFDTAEDVMRVMRENNIHHVPVVRNRKLVGIVTPTDVIRYLVTVLPPPSQVS
ncbi:MAG: CBS domain-containing protein [Polyangiales bacterium]